MLPLTSWHCQGHSIFVTNIGKGAFAHYYRLQLWVGNFLAETSLISEAIAMYNKSRSILKILLIRTTNHVTGWMSFESWYHTHILQQNLVVIRKPYWKLKTEIILNYPSICLLVLFHLKRSNMTLRSPKFYCLAFMIWENSALSEAPPTRKPSISGWAAKFWQFLAFTEPEKENKW